MIKFFHELTTEEYEELLKSGITFAEIDKCYPQPEWCSYHQAVYGAMGCWSLVLQRVHSQTDCGKCEFIRQCEDIKQIDNELPKIVCCPTCGTAIDIKETSGGTK